MCFLEAKSRSFVRQQQRYAEPSQLPAGAHQASAVGALHSGRGGQPYPPRKEHGIDDGCIHPCFISIK